MKSETYDVLVVGAGPAGAAAATILARMEHRIGLIDRRPYPFSESNLRWLSAGAADLLQELGVSTDSFGGNAIQNVTFHSADFAKTATPNFKATPGYLVQRCEVENALVDAAVSAGATFIDDAEVTDLRLQESAVVVGLKDDRTLTGRLQLLAVGSESKLVERGGFTRSVASTLGCSAQVDVPTPGGHGELAPRLELVLGLDAAGSFGFCCLRRDRLSVCVNWKGTAKEATNILAQFCQHAHEADLLPFNPWNHPGNQKAVARFGVAALDMDTHVGKHTLLIGQAGGFIAAASYEGIYPAMWSARIAGDVAHAALSSVHSQDELMTFNSQWRINMAEYLRPPNTDNQFLLPLVFSNQPMTDRMGAAFFFGENI